MLPVLSVVYGLPDALELISVPTCICMKKFLVGIFVKNYILSTL